MVNNNIFSQYEDTVLSNMARISKKLNYDLKVTPCAFYFIRIIENTAIKTQRPLAM